MERAPLASAKPLVTYAVALTMTTPLTGSAMSRHDDVVGVSAGGPGTDHSDDARK